MMHYKFSLSSLHVRLSMKMLSYNRAKPFQVKGEQKCDPEKAWCPIGIESSGQVGQQWATGLERCAGARWATGKECQRLVSGSG